jgi:hypothetical protein
LQVAERRFAELGFEEFAKPTVVVPRAEAESHARAPLPEDGIAEPLVEVGQLFACAPIGEAKGEDCSGARAAKEVELLGELDLKVLLNSPDKASRGEAEVAAAVKAEDAEHWCRFDRQRMDSRGATPRKKRYRDGKGGVAGKHRDRARRNPSHTDE